MMWKDPIVQEVRAARAAIFARCDNDVHKLFEHLRKKRLERMATANRPVKKTRKIA